MPSDRIKLILESISIAYSAFDDRPYSKRDLSANFISELIRKAQEAGGFDEVDIKVKKKARKGELSLLQDRLRGHFASLEQAARRQLWIYKFQATVSIVIAGALLTAENRGMLGEGGLLALLILPASWLALFLGMEYVICDLKSAPGHRILKRLNGAHVSVSN